MLPVRLSSRFMWPNFQSGKQQEVEALFQIRAELLQVFAAFVVAPDFQIMFLVVLKFIII